MSKRTFRHSYLWLLLSSIIIAFRIPEILNGRYWAEDGTLFFQQAWDLIWYQALFCSEGYLNLFANLSGVVANYFLPLEFACYASIFLALLIQILPIFLLGCSRQRWVNDRFNFFCCIAIVTTLPMSQEVWLTSVGSQYHLSLCVAIIMALEPLTGWVRYLEYCILLLAPLSGPGSIILVPLFCLRTFKDRSRQRIIQCGILIAGALIQLLFFFHPAQRIFSHGAKGQTVMGIDPMLLLNIMYVKHLVGPLMGFQETLDITQSFFERYRTGTFVALPGAIAITIVGAVLIFIVWRSKLSSSRWLLASAALLSIVSFGGAFGDRAESLMVAVGERYAFAPQVLFEICLVSLLYSSKGFARTSIKALVVWLLVISIHEYPLTPPGFRTGSTWQHEVAEWKKNSDYKLKIWPDGWSVTLTPKPSHRNRR